MILFEVARTRIASGPEPQDWEWYISDFVPRLKPGASQVLIMTRWHQDDLAGRLLEREEGDWRVIELPMEARPNDPLGRQTGERLWAEHFTAEMVEIAKRDPRAWNALYQQISNYRGRRLL